MFHAGKESVESHEGKIYESEEKANSISRVGMTEALTMAETDESNRRKLALKDHLPCTVTTTTFPMISKDIQKAVVNRIRFIGCCIIMMNQQPIIMESEECSGRNQSEEKDGRANEHRFYSSDE